MQCGDLERYLEAFIDGRLGRGRYAGMRRHLLLCGACRARVERLRQFEREVQRRFRAMEQCPSVWQGLELDLVTSARGSGDDGSGEGGLMAALPRSLPPLRRLEGPRPPVRIVRRIEPEARRARLRRPLSRLVGVVILALAMGSVYELVAGRMGATDGGESGPIAAYRALAASSQPLALHEGDLGKVEAWLAPALDAAAPPHLPRPVGYHAVGADRQALPDGTAAGIVVYVSDAPTATDPLVLFLRHDMAGGASPSPPELVPTAEADVPDAAAAAAADLQQVSWDADSFHYTLVGHGSREHLRQLVQ